MTRFVARLAVAATLALSLTGCLSQPAPGDDLPEGVWPRRAVVAGAGPVTLSGFGVWAELDVPAGTSIEDVPLYDFRSLLLNLTLPSGTVLDVFQRRNGVGGATCQISPQHPAPLGEDAALAAATCRSLTME